jgi:hypothetical protein
MMKSLLASTSLSFALLFLPIGAFGPITGSGGAGVSPAHAEFGVDLGGIIVETDDDDEDDPDDDDWDDD